MTKKNNDMHDWQLATNLGERGYVLVFSTGYLEKVYVGR
jgi:hypothetical protein